MSKVSRDDEGDGTRRVELSGSESAVAEAERLINDILENGNDPLSINNSCDIYFINRFMF